MTKYLESSACRGHQPVEFAGQLRRSRPELIARLLRERRVARFVVAPDGFGKSALVLEYADIVFKFNHVFWLNGRSPCFLRDVDDGHLFDDVRSVDEAPCLVVFEDIPRLDDARAESFSQLVDALLNAGDEVVVTCCPSCDVYESLHHDRLMLGAHALLLSDDELRALPGDNYLSINDLGAVKMQDRIACVKWGESGLRELAEGIRREELPSDLMLAMLVMLLLRSGEMKDISAFTPEKRQQELIEVLMAGYPYLGIDYQEGAYETIDLDVEYLALSFKRDFDRIASASFFRDRDALAGRLADALIDRGQYDRAAQVMQHFATKIGCGLWLSTRGWRFACEAAPKATYDLYLGILRSTHRRRSALNVVAAWSAMQLGDQDACSNLAKRMTSPSTCLEDRVLASVLLMRGGTHEMRKKARVTLESFNRACAARSVMDESEEEEFSAPYVCWRALGLLAYAAGEGDAAGLARWDELRAFYEERRAIGEDLASFERALLLGAAWLLEDVLVRGEAFAGPDGGSGADGVFPYDRVVAFVCDCLDERMAEERAVGWFELRAFLALESCAAKRPEYAYRQPSATAVSQLHIVEMRLISQCNDYFAEEGKRIAKRDEYERTNPRGVLTEPRHVRPGLRVPQLVPPVLHVGLFGGLTVTMGDKPIDSKYFSRQKTKVLLAILVLNRGREVSRDRLAELLWPGSEPLSAKKNFYSVWSQLKKALTVEDMGCPYLIRDQRGCRIDMRLVTSDVFQFEVLCRSLLFGRADAAKWEAFFTTVCEDYAEELMPSEQDNELVCAVRERFRVQLVDALIAASERLASEGEIQGALWFAREALQREQAREDVYAAMMRAQIAAGQRSAALETYFACRAFLAEELGIDPSVQLVNLYRKIIEDEERLE